MREFLTSRRARITPEQAGLPTYGGKRRVVGLRREEVAVLTGVSADYYSRLERGNVVGASDAVLDALARALQLDPAERDHLFDLARTDTAGLESRRSRPRQSHLQPEVQQVLDAITDGAADVRNERGDILATNKLAFALYSEIHAEDQQPPNVARYTFLNATARDFFVDWAGAATDMVSVLRAAVGRNPYDKPLSDLIGELATRSEEFRVRWAAHDVRQHSTGTKHLRHPIVGEIELNYLSFELPEDPGLRLVVFTAEPNSPHAQALRFLAQWAANDTHAEPNPMHLDTDL